MTSAGTMKAFRWAQLLSLSLVLLFIGLVMLSGLGTLMTTSLSQPIVSAQGDITTVSMTYHSLNPGPFQTDDVVVTARLLDPSGNPLISPTQQTFKVGAFATSSGNLTFSLDFSSIPKGLYDAWRNGTVSMTLAVGLSSGVSSLVKVTIDSNLTITGVE